MKTILQQLLGVIKSLLMVLNLLILPTLVVIIALLRLIPIKWFYRPLSYLIYEVLTPLWIDINGAILSLGSRTQWNVSQHGELHRKGWYFLMSNHRSWADILVLQKVFNRKIPMLKFFMKQELLWTLPIGGLAAWLLDFPFMKRHSKQYLKKHPEQRDKDIETTRKKCEAFKNQPVTIINFLEGTRFTPDKQQQHTTPYGHLLSPRAGGMAFTFATMEGVLHELIDVTLCYLPANKSLWDLLCGNVDTIVVDITVTPIPETLRGDYYNDKAFKKHFQHWLNDRWAEKDLRIQTFITEHHS